MINSPKVIGIAGKIGSGKNFLATKLAEVYNQRGFRTAETAYGVALKDEATVLIEEFKKPHPNFKYLAYSNNLLIEGVHALYAIVKDELPNNPSMTGWTRSETVRAFLQFLGTGLRRQQDSNYWVNKISETFPTNADYVFVTDIRYPNEAQKILDLNGYLIHLNVPDEIILLRTSQRDGLKYSQSALNHDSEKALIGFKHFDLQLGEKFITEEIIDCSIDPVLNKRSQLTVSSG